MNPPEKRTRKRLIWIHTGSSPGSFASSQMKYLSRKDALLCFAADCNVSKKWMNDL